MAKDDKKKKKGPGQGHDEVVDLAARIGARQSAPESTPPPEAAPPDQPPPPPPTRLDGPIPSAPKPRLVPAKEDRAQSAMIQKALVEESQKPEPAIPSPRGAPGPGEVDLVVTPLPTADDWHRFELALRKVRGVGQLRTEYYRHGVLKVRVKQSLSRRRRPSRWRTCLLPRRRGLTGRSRRRRSPACCLRRRIARRAR